MDWDGQPGKHGIRCNGCNRRTNQYSWRNYFCPKCGTLHLDLYRAEHLYPERAAAMSADDIVAECEDAGMAVAHGWA